MLATFGVLAALIIAGVIFGVLNSAGSKSHRVTFRVSGTAPTATVTERTPKGLEQHAVRLPYSSQVDAPTGAQVSLFATLDDLTVPSATVTCDILLDGAVAKTTTSQGGVLTSCSTDLQIP